MSQQKKQTTENKEKNNTKDGWSKKKGGVNGE